MTPKRENLVARTIVIMIIAAPVAADPMEAPWWTADCGGGTMTTAGGTYELVGTIAQSDASSVLTAGAFELAGGFWPGVNPQPGPPLCPADLNGDGTVNTLDLGALLAAWSVPAGSAGCGGAVPCAADLDGSGTVNSLDLGMLLAAWSIPAGSPGCQ